MTNVFGRRILVTLKQNTRNIFFYFLNPLVILELTGNLHFEGVMLLFLTLGFYFLDKLQTTKAAFLIAISISIKLLPLLILPLFFKRLAFKKSVWFYFLVIFFNILFFFPFINASLISNYLATISLWFTNFEFNSSFYYIVREVGFYVKGYNIIGVVGKIIPILTIALVLFFSFFRNNKTTLSLIPNILLVLTLYFFISTTVHPWYVINLILLSVFTNFRFPLVWSLFVILSYYAYSVVPFKENLLLIFIEYFFVIGFFIYELRLNCKLKIPNNFL